MALTTNRSSLFALLAALTAGASTFAACVSNTVTGAPGSPDGSFDLDSSTRGLDVTIPSNDAPSPVDSAPGADSGTQPGDSTAPPSPDAGADAGDATGPADTGSPDAADGALADAGVTYADALAPSSWSAFDTA